MNQLRKELDDLRKEIYSLEKLGCNTAALDRQELRLLERIAEEKRARQGVTK